MATDSSTPPLGLAAGDPVLVRTRFDGTWAAGFAIQGESDGGYLIRRASDSSVLPTVFQPTELLPARGLDASSSAAPRR